MNLSVYLSRQSLWTASVMPSARRPMCLARAVKPPKLRGDWRPLASPIWRMRSHWGGRGASA